MIIRRLLSLTIGIHTPSDDCCHTMFGELSQLTALLPSPPPETSLDIVYKIEESNGEYRIVGDGTSREGVRWEEVFCEIQEDLAIRLVQNRIYWLLHAASLVNKGKAVLLAGESGSGKTTLAALLLKEGYRYMSDEFAPLSFNMNVMPYPLPLRLRESALRLLPPLLPELALWPTPFCARGEKVFYGLPASWLLPHETGVPVGMVVFPYVCSSGRTDLKKVKQGIAALRLISLTLNREILGEAGVTSVVDLVQQVPCYDLVIGEIGEAVKLISEAAMIVRTAI